MGLVYADITLSNARHLDLRPMQATALVDTGAFHLCIPEHIVTQLKLETIETREVEFGDGKKGVFPYVGPILLKFDNRQAFCGAMVLGNEVLLGAIPMEDLDVIVHPKLQKLMVNPENPNMACGKVKKASISESDLKIKGI
jgi:clan AA aspartic protease